MHSLKNRSYIILSIILGTAFHFAKAQCGCCGPGGSGFSGTESTPGVYTLRKKQILVEAYSEYRSYKGSDKSQNDADISSLAPIIKDLEIGILGIRYGISNKASLVLQQPYFVVRTNMSTNNSPGDLMSLVNYNLVNKAKFNLAVQAGMEWPTGNNNNAGINSSAAMGSGSFDPVAGINFIRIGTRSSLRAGIFAKYSTLGFDQIRYGSFLGHQLGYSYFLINRSNACCSDSTAKSCNCALSLNAIISGEWIQPQLQNHIYIDNTGGYSVLGNIGATFNIKKLSIPVIVSIPCYSKLRGYQELNTLRVRVGISLTFN